MDAVFQVWSHQARLEGEVRHGLGCWIARTQHVSHCGVGDGRCSLKSFIQLSWRQNDRSSNTGLLVLMAEVMVVLNHFKWG